MECAMISGPSTQHPVTSQVLEEKIKVAIHPEYTEQTMAIGSTLTEKGRKKLCTLLRQNLDVFAWKPVDVTGVPRHIAEHRLNVREGCLPEEMFLGYKVNTDELKVCPDKEDTVLNFPSPGCLKDVQKLNEKLASLNRFLSKSAEKSLPFFKTLKKCTKKSDFQWTQEAEIAFRQMKKLIAELPMFTAPKEREELIMYLAAAKEPVSAVLMTEREGKQMLVYFVSRALQGSEINYTPMEKLVLALLSTSQRYQSKDKYWQILSWNDQRKNPRMNSWGRTEELPEPLDFCMVQYFEKVKTLTSNFKEFCIKQAPQSENKKADALSKIASTSFAHLSKQVLVEEIKENSINEKEVLAIVEEEGHT
ncbi:reverse transcriptase domain-containing protein [Tanacetum coccineum]